MKKNITLIAAIVFAFALIFTGCAKEKPNDADTPPANEKETSDGTTMAPDILGEILEVQNDDVLRVLVESDGTVKGQIWMTVTDETQFIDPQGNYTTPEDPAALFVIGEKAAILSTGIIMESYPMQGSASIVYLDD